MKPKAAKRLRVVARDPEPLGYYGQPVLKGPVWTWEVPLYFWIGGTAGMAAVIALASLAGTSELGTARAALWIAVFGALVSPVLLILDLGRPLRFLNMLRVLKLRSPMSVGVWTLVMFSVTSLMSAFLFESFGFLHQELEIPKEVLSTVLTVTMIGAGTSGAVLATYTGVLLGATAIPVWSSHARLLPAIFGVASLGSAASLLVLFDYRIPAIEILALASVIAETVLLALQETVRRGSADLPLREGTSGRRMRLAGILMGPVALGLWMIGAGFAGSLVFLIGAILSRYAWIAAGRASALDPRAVLSA
jgi:formate-dependent nitrite reductase membrane component NrfD